MDQHTGHGANPIFCNVKIKSGRPEHSLNPTTPTFDNISLLPYLPPPPSHLKVDVICVSSPTYSENCAGDHIKHQCRAAVWSFTENELFHSLINYLNNFFVSFPHFPNTKGQTEVEWFIMSWIGLYKFPEVVFGITEKLLYILSPNLDR